MSGKQYLADTNAFIYLLQKRPVVVSLLNSDWFFSFITEIELLGKPRIGPGELKRVRELLSVAKKLVHTDSINEKAISLRQRYGIKVPDAIIAASAWQYDLPLITADVAFTKIKEVNILLLDIA
ncbi:MAG: PilT protein domain protein [Bacteroidetes bacterium OLB12]|nr:MAG: PilT protein domain protein [Bacteroidetes bacterium OLB12]HNR73778.1 type II toxin-antitoxin system VapC family toxin [Cyclobacteriaceae bacterium]HNU41550.1 type II toxin-antitoxin system VapC family toxin [Cyclobacteriaceae bacterium]